MHVSIICFYVLLPFQILSVVKNRSVLLPIQAIGSNVLPTAASLVLTNGSGTRRLAMTLAEPLSPLTTSFLQKRLDYIDVRLSAIYETRSVSFFPNSLTLFSQKRVQNTAHCVSDGFGQMCSSASPCK